jgi:hypothetical protein
MEDYHACTSFGLYESQGAPPPTQEEAGEKYVEAVRLKRYREAEAERLVREAGPKVTGEELKRRIQGIGPREIGEGQMREAREKKSEKGIGSDSSEENLKTR